jgi:predicted Zn-dependent peptidase
MTLIVVGDVDIEELAATVGTTFGTLEARSGAPRLRSGPLLTGRDTTYRTTRDAFVGGDVYATRDFLVPPLPARDTFRLLLAATLLEGELFTRLRSDRGWAYTPTVSLADYADFSVLVVEAEVPRGFEDATFAVMDDAMRALAEGEVSGEAFEVVRRESMLQFGLGLETNAEVADYYVRFLDAWRASGTFPNLVEEVASVTEDEVQAAVQRYLLDAPSLRYAATGLPACRRTSEQDRGEGDSCGAAPSRELQEHVRGRPELSCEQSAPADG